MAELAARFDVKARVSGERKTRRSPPSSSSRAGAARAAADGAVVAKDTAAEKPGLCRGGRGRPPGPCSWSCCGAGEGDRNG